MDAEGIVSTYENLSRVMGRMVEAARAGEWDTLIALESDCKALVDELKRSDIDVPMSPALRARKAQLLRKLLSDDAQIRDFTEPWLAQLSLLVGSIDRERKLQHSYGL